MERVSGPSRAAVAGAVALFVGAIAAAALFWSAQHGEPPPVTSAQVAVEPPSVAPPEPVSVAAAPAPATEAAPPPATAPAPAPAPAKKPAAAPAKKPPSARPESAVAKRAPSKRAEPRKRPEPAAPATVAAAPRPAAEEDAPVEARNEDEPPKAAKAEAPKVAEAPVEKGPLAAATRALRDGRFDEAQKAVSAVLAKSPDDADAKALQARIATARDGIARGQTAFEQADCVGALEALEPVLEVAPNTSAARRIVASCRAALPPRQL
jgi:hypothetical protein